MTIYIILMLYIAFISLIKGSKIEKICVLFVPIIFIASLRSSNVGNDVQRYADLYQIMCNTSLNHIFDTNADVGYVVFEKLISYVSNNSQFFIGLCSAIICFNIGRAIYKHSINISMSTYLFVTEYFLFYSFSAIRQYIALSFLVIAFLEFIEKNYLKTFIYTLIGSSFHYSAIVVIPMMLLSHFRITKRNIKLFLIACFAIILSYRWLFFYVVNSFQRYSYYSDNDFSKSGRGIDINILIYIFHFIIIVYSIFLLYKYISRRKNATAYKNELLKNEAVFILDQEYRYIYCYMISTVFTFAFDLASITMGSADRLGQFSKIFTIFEIPLLISTMGENNRKVISFLIYILFFIYCILMLSHNNWRVVPYEFFW